MITRIKKKKNKKSKDGKGEDNERPDKIGIARLGLLIARTALELGIFLTPKDKKAQEKAKEAQPQMGNPLKVKLRNLAIVITLVLAVRVLSEELLKD
ncbi:MAG: hypothetical protein ACHQ6U_11625 [Thermodesulfobacteriota bacterium]